MRKRSRSRSSCCQADRRYVAPCACPSRCSCIAHASYSHDFHYGHSRLYDNWILGLCACNVFRACKNSLAGMFNSSPTAMAVCLSWASQSAGSSSRKSSLTICSSFCLKLFFFCISDANFIFVSHFHAKIPGGYWFLIVGPIVEGTLGGLLHLVFVFYFAYLCWAFRNNLRGGSNTCIHC